MKKQQVQTKGRIKSIIEDDTHITVVLTIRTGYTEAMKARSLHLGECELKQ